MEADADLEKDVYKRQSLGENAAVIALKAVVADMISYAALFVLAKLLVSQFISVSYTHLDVYKRQWQSR